MIERTALLCLLSVASISCAGASGVAPVAAVAAQPQRATPPELGQWIDAYVSALGRNWGPTFAFSGYVAVGRNGKWVFGRSYGKANYDASPPTESDADTRFRIGSITKQFTAVAVMQLVERGALRVADPVRLYVPALSGPIGEVSLHQLLNQSSGIASYTDDATLMEQDGQPHAPSEVLATFQHAPLRFTPGERFEYSNSNYFLLGLVIEKVSGLSYEAYLQKFVLGPAGMHRTSTIDAPDAPNTAAGYAANATDDGLVADGPFDMSLPFSAGALRSTANDLLAWDRAWSAHALLSAATQARMTRLEPGLVQPDGSGYGYGLGVAQLDGREVILHAGGIDGFSSFLARVPEEGWFVIALCNSMAFPAARIAKPIVKMLVSGAPLAPPVEPPAGPPSPELARAAAGTYELSEETRAMVAQKLPREIVDSIAEIELQTESNRLYFVQRGQPRVEIFRSPDGELFSKRAELKLAFEPDTAAPQAVRVQQGPFQFRFVRKP